MMANSCILFALLATASADSSCSAGFDIEPMEEESYLQISNKGGTASRHQNLDFSSHRVSLDVETDKSDQEKKVLREEEEDMAETPCSSDMDCPHYGSRLGPKFEKFPSQTCHLTRKVCIKNTMEPIPNPLHANHMCAAAPGTDLFHSGFIQSMLPLARMDYALRHQGPADEDQETKLGCKCRTSCASQIETGQARCDFCFTEERDGKPCGHLHPNGKDHIDFCLLTKRRNVDENDKAHSKHKAMWKMIKDGKGIGAQPAANRLVGNVPGAFDTMSWIMEDGGGDLRPLGKPRYAHPTSMMCEVTLDNTDDSFTGFFAKGKHVGIARIDDAGWTNRGVLKRSFGFKFFRDGMQSANLLTLGAMKFKREAKDGEYVPRMLFNDPSDPTYIDGDSNIETEGDWFARAPHTVVHQNQPHGRRAPDDVVQVLRVGGRCLMRLGHSEFASAGKDGKKVVRPKFPYDIAFVPAEGLHTKNNITEDCPFRKQDPAKGPIPVDQDMGVCNLNKHLIPLFEGHKKVKAWEMWYNGHPEDSFNELSEKEMVTRKKLGDVYLSNCMGSEWADQRFKIRHQEAQQDLVGQWGNTEWYRWLRENKEKLAKSRYANSGNYAFNCEGFDGNLIGTSVPSCDDETPLTWECMQPSGIVAQQLDSNEDHGDSKDKVDE